MKYHIPEIMVINILHTMHWVTLRSNNATNMTTLKMFLCLNKGNGINFRKPVIKINLKNRLTEYERRRSKEARVINCHRKFRSNKTPAKNNCFTRP